MSKRYPVAAVAGIVLWAAHAGATVSISAGFGSLPGRIRYLVQDVTSIADQPTGVEAFKAGSAGGGFELVEDVGGHVAIGLRAGVFLPRTFTFDEMRRLIPAPGIPHPNEGDTTAWTFVRIPLLGTASLSLPAGPGTAVLGLALGATVIGWTKEISDQIWWDGVTWGPWSSAQDLVYNQRWAKRVTTSRGAAAALTAAVAPGYRYALGARTTIGLEFPLAYVARTILEGDRFDYQGTPPAGTPPPPNPKYLPIEIEVGGFTWGANLTFSVRL